MQFSQTEEQKLLAASLARFTDKDYSFSARRGYAATASGFSAAVWRTLADLGVLGLGVAPQYGGYGGSLSDLGIAAEAFGRVLLLEPFLASAVLGADLVGRAGTPQQRERILPQLVSGALQLAFAHYEPGSRFDRGQVDCRAAADGSAWRLHGHKRLVIHGASANELIVSARHRGGIGLFLLPTPSPGITCRSYRTVDDLSAADFDFDGAAAIVLGDASDASAEIDRAIDRACSVLAMEAVGVMAAMHQQTVDYCKTREQFGGPIARFQVLQHRMVDMLVTLEQTRSLAMYATSRGDLDAAGAPTRRRAVAAALAYISRAGRRFGQEAIQLHGGMGMTDELAIGHYFKRLTAIAQTFGDADYFLDRFAD
jgi:alkylation response protein AidB-like acyl-CoA dehydrogenase